MKHCEWILVIAALLFVVGCGAEESDCENYLMAEALDRNFDGETDYRYQFIGDSIIAYSEIACKSIGHQVGKAVNEQVLLRAVTGAYLDQILLQYNPPPEGADYDWIIMNGGMNDLLKDPEAGGTACNCNGETNAAECTALINRLSNKLAGFIDSVNATSQAGVALLTYYPPDDENSFIGACFPYADMLNDRYRELAAGNSRVWVVETYGQGIPVIEKISQYGLDRYHPTAAGSNQLAEQIISTLDLPTQ